MTSVMDVDTRFTHVIAVLTATGVNLNPAPETELRSAVLILPEESTPSTIVDTPMFKVAMAQSSQRYTYDLESYQDEAQAYTYTYVNLSNDQLLQILPYVTQRGISETPLMALVFDNGTGNLLVQAQYTDEVLSIISANPRRSVVNLYNLFASDVK